MLDPGSPMPLYQQLKVALRRAIDAGEWAPGQAIPPERSLIERYGVSRITVRQALADLEAAGVLVRRHGKGTFVAPSPHGVIAESLSELTGHLEELQLRGLEPEVEVLELVRCALPPEVTAALQRPDGANGWYLRRLVRVSGIPLMLTAVYLPDDLPLPLEAESLRHEGIAPLLERHGLVPVRGAQRIGAEAASTADAALLAVAPGDALLRVVRVMHGPDDRPLVWFRTLYRADRYEYEVHLKRRR